MFLSWKTRKRVKTPTPRRRLQTKITEQDLSADIIETILLKLPFKSLLRFKAVCKPWNTIISDPHFVHTQLHQSGRSHSQNLFIHKYPRVAGFSLVEFRGGELRNLKNFGEPYSCDRVLCFCDGMILLGSYSIRACVLWNPSARSVMKFWFPYSFRDHWCVMCHGIWHDRRSDDVKVIFTDSHFYAVFSCKNKTWTKKKNYLHSRVLIRDSGVCAHGVVYWTAIVEGAIRVTYYDPVEDDFFLLDGPEGVGESKPVYITDLGGYLCLYCDVRDEKTVQIWKMDDTLWRWEEWMTVENAPTSLSDGFKPLCFVGDKIVIRLGTTKLVVYSPSAKTYKELFEDTSLYGVRFVPYVESLLCSQNMTRLKRRRTSVDFSSYICDDDDDDDDDN